jgi:hypothetical protein
MSLSCQLSITVRGTREKIQKVLPAPMQAMQAGDSTHSARGTISPAAKSMPAMDIYDGLA